MCEKMRPLGTPRRDALLVAALYFLPIARAFYNPFTSASAEVHFLD